MTVGNQVQIIDGKATAAAVRKEVAAMTSKLVERGGPKPGLTVVLVGEDPASQVYVRNKDRAATEAGFEVDTIRLPAETSQQDLEATVDRLVLVGPDGRVENAQGEKTGAVNTAGYNIHAPLLAARPDSACSFSSSDSAFASVATKC